MSDKSRGDTPASILDDFSTQELRRMMSAQLFIFELIRAANEVERLAIYERSNLLQGAAATIRNYREEINFSGSPAIDNGPGDIIHDLRRMADQIQDCADDDVKSALLGAADTIKTLKTLLEEREKARRGE